MNVDKFIKNLTMRYPSGATDIRLEDIEGYIERTKITETQLDTIDLLVQENYGKTSFPTVKDIKDMYEKGYSIISGQKHLVDHHREKTNDIYYPQAFVCYVCDQQNMCIEDIIKFYKIYETKKINQHEMNTYENYFLYIFSDLINNYRARKAKNIKGENNRTKTEYELSQLMQDQKIEIEREPVPTLEDLKIIKEMFKGVEQGKIIKTA
ncbi:MAG: hypothetical protein PVF17_00955 [Ignavibacteria bacterium]|jgi:hypothetical protein